MQKLNLTSNLPFHLTARCINKEWFGLPLPTLWSIMEDYLFFLTHAYEVHIHSFVLMPNHFHLLATFPRANLSQSMQYFMRETSRRICEGTDRINHVYGSRFHRSLIDSHHYFHHVYKYVYRNPVKAGLANTAQIYPYSTLTGLVGHTKMTIPLVEDHVLFSDFTGTIQWLNTPPDQESESQVRKALRRKKFALPIDPKTKHRSHLEYLRL